MAERCTARVMPVWRLLVGGGKRGGGMRGEQAEEAGGRASWSEGRGSGGGGGGGGEGRACLASLHCPARGRAQEGDDEAAEGKERPLCSRLVGSDA